VFRLDRIDKAWREAGSFNEQVNLFGFIDDQVFLTKSGDAGVVLESAEWITSASNLRRLIISPSGSNRPSGSSMKNAGFASTSSRPTAVPRTGERHFFWTGESKIESAVTN
jgi:hypothetical protein